MEREKLDEREIPKILARFYERVRADAELGPVFAVVADWDEHLVRLSEFWSSVMLTTGRYKGNPVSMHMIHAERIRPEMFDRWLALWRLTTSEMLPQHLAIEMQAKATRIASRLSRAIRPEASQAYSGQPAKTAGPTTPYRITSAFDEASLPQALLRSHALKSGTWGVIRVHDGAVRYRADGATQAILLDRYRPGIVPPEVPHRLELAGPVNLQIEFYDRNPGIEIS
ncbi:DUF1971 domain-containing protein [Sinorhizobium terangae]|uniref:DUF1971 domain-containing protein n=1 Tax=Sinorhizobium terangae TaxID=110322 RepID=UPI0017EBA1DB|nr:DUF1971 domain-containing protein [Sinorhizobium terangae]MBB4188621.1 truncated hemoglobin YjbI/tellurite resistance-related uncharacterized protein [Sinorhizobium terangae]WFU49839.1 DUF1971 domain-containing protein [Sinorhizobium terangae]